MPTEETVACIQAGGGLPGRSARPGPFARPSSAPSPCAPSRPSSGPSSALSRALFFGLSLALVSLAWLALPVRVASSTGQGHTEAAEATVVTLGMSAAFTGPSRGLGVEYYRGMTAFFNSWNASRPAHAPRVAVKAYDDGYNPLPTLKNTVRLVERDGVFALFNYIGTPTVTRMLPLLMKYEDRNIYLFFPLTGAQPHREAPYGRFVYNLRASYRQETRGLVDRLVATGCRRLAVFYQADAYGRSGWDGVRRALGSYSLDTVAEATYRRGGRVTDSYAEAVRLVMAGGPDAIVCIGAYAACAGFIRDARDAGFTGAIANVSFVDADNMLAMLKLQSRESGRDYTRKLVVSQVAPSYEDVSLPAVRAYRRDMDAHAESPPAHLLTEPYRPRRYGFVSLEGYLNAKLMAEVIERLGPNPVRRDLPAAIESIRDYDLGIGVPVGFSAGNHQGVSEVYFTTVEDGQFMPVRDWEALAP